MTPSASGSGTTLTTGGNSVTADASGNYSFGSLANGNYTVSPSKAGFIFTPASQTVTVNGANVSGVNFVAQPVVTPTGIQLVQKSVNGNEASATSISASLTSSVTQGNFLIVTGTAARPARTISISDTAGNTYLPAIGPLNEPIQDVNAYIWYVPSAKAGLNTITPDLVRRDSARRSTSRSGPACRQTCRSTVLPQELAAGRPSTTASLTTSAAGELVFGYTFAGTSATAGSGFTTLSLINGDPDEFEIQPTSGASVAATFSQPPGGAWLALMMLVKPAGAVGSAADRRGVSARCWSVSVSDDDPVGKRQRCRKHGHQRSISGRWQQRRRSR